MYTKLVEGQIIFYFAHTDLFEDIKHESAFMCKNIASKEGDDLSENYAITDDEDGMLKICLREALPDIYDTIMALTHGISDAYYDSITGEQIKALDTELADLSVTDTAYYVVLRTVDHKAYNPNDVKLVDSALLSAIESGAIMQFYTRVIHPDLTKLSGSVAVAQLQALDARIIPLRKRTTL